MLYQWHIVDEKYKPSKTVDFSNIKSNEIVYQVGNDEQKAKVDELIEKLELEDYVPKKSYEELKAVYPKPVPLFISHVELFARTATLLELEALGLGGKAVETAFPLGLLPNKVYRCCGYFYNHPGCYFGPVKYENTPWKLVPDDFSTRIWITNDIGKLWNSKIVKGAYHLKDPSNLIIELKKRLTDRVIEYVRNGTGEPEENLGVEYFMLKEYGTIDWGIQRPAGPLNPQELPNSPLSPDLSSDSSSDDESPLDTTIPEGPNDEPGSDDEVTLSRELTIRNLLSTRDFDTAMDNINDRELKQSLVVLKGFENYSNQEVFDAFEIISNLVVEPYGNDGLIVSNPEPTNYFEWHDNSCWYDSFITCLFTNPGSKIESNLRKTGIMFTNCDKNAIRNAIMDDIEYIQSPFSRVEKAKGIEYFTQDCVEIKEEYGAFGEVYTTFLNFRKLFALKIDNIKFSSQFETLINDFITNQIDRSLIYNGTDNVVAFVSIRYTSDKPERSSHYLAHVQKESGDWIRIDGYDESVVQIDNIDEYLRLEGTIVEIKSIESEIVDGNETGNMVEVIERKFMKPFMFLLGPRILKRSPPTTPIRSKKDYFNRWKQIRDEYDDLVQPVYLSQRKIDFRQKQLENNKRVEMPAHNEKFYNPATDVSSLTIDSYPKDIGRTRELTTPERLFEKLEKLKSLFSFIKDKDQLNALLRVAMIPKYEGILEDGRIFKSTQETDYETEKIVLERLKRVLKE